MSSTVYRLSFTSTVDGWAATRDGLLATTDGGRTWQPVATGAVGIVSRVAFHDELHGWLLVSRPQPGTTPWPRTLLRTDDGGVSWVSMSDPCAITTVIYLSFPGTLEGYALCNGQPAPGPTYKALYRTTDTGATWVQISESPITGRAPANSLAQGGSATDLFFLDDRHGWISTDRFGALATDDGGYTWRHLSSVSAADDFLSTVRFATSAIGYVVSYPTYTGRAFADVPALYTTGDGGQTWSEVCVGWLIACDSAQP